MGKKKKKFRDLAPRVISGVVGAAIIVASIYLSQWSFLFVFMCIQALTLDEFYRLLEHQGYRPNRILGIIIGCMLFGVVFLVATRVMQAPMYLIVFVITTFGFILKLYDRSDKQPFINTALFFLGLVYIALPYSLINFLVIVDTRYTYGIFIGVIFLTWANDIGAYFAGSFFGQNKLFKRISPKKSWEGTMGGAIFSLIVVLLNDYLFDDLPLWEWIVISIIITIAGTFGDLIESHFKRSIEIKDSGSIIPGHGGFMDRFDSLMMAVPFVVLFIEIF